jgi:hypothetical protein
MAIVQAGKTFTATELKSVAGGLAAALQTATTEGSAFRIQLESWPDADLVALGLAQDEINAIKGFFVGDLPTIVTQLQASAWIKQLVGTGV